MRQSLTLVPVGVGAAYARAGEAQSAYLVRAGDRAICLDLGAGTFNRLQRHVSPEDLEALIVTHMHPDHCVDLFAMHVYLAYGPGRDAPPLRVIGPPELEARLDAFAGEAGGFRNAFTFEPSTEGTLDLGGGLAVTFAEVPHLPPTHALRVDLGEASIAYSADCSPNDALPALAAGCDVLLCECSFGDLPVPVGVLHLDAAGAADVAARAGAGRLLLTHCYPEVDRDATLALVRAGFDGPVDWARQDQAVSA